jgi:hypothetical protein
MAIALLKGMHWPKRLISSKAYHIITLRRWLRKQRIEVVILSSATRAFSFPFGRKQEAQAAA